MYLCNSKVVFTFIINCSRYDLSQHSHLTTVRKRKKIEGRERKSKIKLSTVKCECVNHCLSKYVETYRSVDKEKVWINGVISFGFKHCAWGLKKVCQNILQNYFVVANNVKIFSCYAL